MLNLRFALQRSVTYPFSTQTINSRQIHFPELNPARGQHKLATVDGLERQSCFFVLPLEIRENHTRSVKLEMNYPIMT